MTSAQVIVLATPFFLLLIGVEFLVGLKRGRNTYRLNDAMNSIGLGIISQLVNLFAALFTVWLYVLVFDRASWWKLPADAWWVWLSGLVLYDFLYYWHHRFGHTVALF
jgi:sterol desaturase/sphingolipid hydroxylase (fatty acid hydroxylase superfamily)